MHARLGLSLAFAVVSWSSIARAQAPGEVAPQPLPPPAMPAAPPEEAVMASRWSLALSIGALGLTPEAQPDATTTFHVAELALRFRATPHLELALVVGGGRDRTPDHMDGNLEVTTGLLAARYRFRPAEAWNWYLMAGLGGAAVTRVDATSQERDQATQPMGALGIGVERRFGDLALHGELRGIALGERQDTSTIDIYPPPAPVSTRQSGGSLSIGLNYYF